MAPQSREQQQRHEAALEPNLDGFRSRCAPRAAPARRSAPQNRSVAASSGGARSARAMQPVLRDVGVACRRRCPSARRATRSPGRPTRAARARRRNRVRCSFLCSQTRLQPAAQTRAATKQVALDGAGRETRDAGDLGDRHLVQVIQRQHGPLQGRQRLDLRMQRRAELGVGARRLEVEAVGDAARPSSKGLRRRPARRSESACARDGAARPSTRPARSRSSGRSRTGTDAGSDARAGTCPGRARAYRRGVATMRLIMCQQRR